MFERLSLTLAMVTSVAAAQTATPVTFVNIRAEYPSDSGSLRDHASYLAMLQRRYLDAGLRVLVCLPVAAATRQAMQAPVYALSAREKIERPRLVLQGLGELGSWDAPDPDAFADLIEASMQPQDPSRLDAMAKLHRYVRTFIEDGPAIPEGTARYVELFPHSGFAHACCHIDRLWNRADLAGAHACAEASLGTLGGDSWPLVRFCDLVLRADANDRPLAAKIAAALQLVLAAEPEAALARLCWLRAQLRADASKVSVADAERIWPIVEPDVESATFFAEVLAGAPDAARFRELVERALAAVTAMGAHARWLHAVSYKAAVRCAHDEAEAERCITGFLGDKQRAYELNTEAWRLLVEFETMGRFDDLALALMERVQRELGDEMGDAMLDTLALALFGNARFDEAIASEAKAIEIGDGDPRYEVRRLRFQRTRDAVQPR